MKRVIITGAFSNNCPPYQNLARWQIRNLNKMDLYAEHVGADLFVVDNSTKFQEVFNTIREAGKNLPCGWCVGTLCSVWGFNNLINKYNEYVWMDLDIVPNIKYNIFEILNKPFHIQHDFYASLEEKTYHTALKKKTFSVDFLKCNNDFLCNVAAGIIKMDQETATKFQRFVQDYILLFDLIEFFAARQTEPNRYDFLCDECVYEGFINKTEHFPDNIKVEELIINFHELDQYQQMIIMKNKTDKFVHFASSYKQYIPEFLKTQEELQ